MKAMHTTIPAYHRALAREDKAICDLLKAEIEKALPQAESKIWHGAPVWFLDGNPIQWDYLNIARRKGRLERIQPAGLS